MLKIKNYKNKIRIIQNIHLIHLIIIININLILNIQMIHLTIKIMINKIIGKMIIDFHMIMILKIRKIIKNFNKLKINRNFNIKIVYKINKINFKITQTLLNIKDQLMIIRLI